MLTKISLLQYYLTVLTFHAYWFYKPEIIINIENHKPIKVKFSINSIYLTLYLGAVWRWNGYSQYQYICEILGVGFF
jgi:hypothetical protein